MLRGNSKLALAVMGVGVVKGGVYLWMETGFCRQ